MDFEKLEKLRTAGYNLIDALVEALSPEQDQEQTRYNYIEDLLLQSFSVPASDFEITHFITATAIAEFLKSKSPAIGIHPQPLGIALSKAGFKSRTKRFPSEEHPVRCWMVKLIAEDSLHLLTKYKVPQLM